MAANEGDEVLGADDDREGLAFEFAVSAFSAAAGEAESSICDVEARGLSVFDVPGILDLIEPLKDFIDSFVSDLLNEGYDLRSSPSERSTDVDEAFLDDLDPSWPFEG